MSNSTLSQILKRLMFEKQIRATELARKIGMHQPTVHRIAEGTIKQPHESSLVPIAKFFNVSIEQLRGETPINWLDVHGVLKEGPETISAVPVLNWEEAEENPQNLHKTNTRRKSIIIDKHIGINAFALIMKDSSMYPLFPKGTLLIVDPDKEAKDRSFIIIKIKNQQQIIFRQLFIDAHQRYIKPLSPDLNQFKMLAVNNNDRICGILVQARMDFEI